MAAGGNPRIGRFRYFSNKSSWLSIERGPYLSGENAEARDFFPLEKAVGMRWWRNIRAAVPGSRGMRVKAVARRTDVLRFTISTVRNGRL
jgi:hypothetical protein